LDASTGSSPEPQAAQGGNRSDNFSTVKVHQEDTVGAIFLGVMALALFVALLRAEARSRHLAAQLAAGRG